MKKNIYLGKYIASVHSCLDKFKRKINRKELNQSYFIDESLENIIKFREAYNFDIEFLNETSVAIKENIDKFIHRDFAYGICHGDIHESNIKYNLQKEPVLFDFDFCGYGWRAYDVSIYTNNIYILLDENKKEYLKRRQCNFFDGYNSIKNISQDEIDATNLFIIYRRFFIIGQVILRFMKNILGDYEMLIEVNNEIDKLKRCLKIIPY